MDPQKAISYRFNLVTVIALAVVAVTARGQGQELASEMSDVLLFDTGAALAGELPSAALAEKAGWVKVEKDAVAGQFKGDVVFLNGRIAVALRKSAAAQFGSAPSQNIIDEALLRVSMMTERQSGGGGGAAGC